MSTSHTAYVFFASSRLERHRPMPLWRTVRLVVRRPRLMAMVYVMHLLRRVNASPLTHVCIGDGQVVLDPVVRRDRFWSHQVFVLGHPTLRCGFTVPVPRPVNLDRFQDDRPKRVLPTLLRWWTGGRWKTRDCVCTTIALLNDAGVPVPATIYRPIDLHHWLTEHGFDFTSFEAHRGWLTDDGGRTDPGA